MYFAILYECIRSNKNHKTDKMSESIPLCFNQAANINMFSFAATAVLKSVNYLIEYHKCLLSAFSVMHSLAGYLDIVETMKVLL
jgi:hypothetical protein